MAGHFPDDTNKLAQTALLKKLAVMKVTGATWKAMAEEVGLSVGRVQTLARKPECQEYIRQLGNDAYNEARSRIKKESALLAQDLMDTLREHLKDRNLNAVPYVLKILGFNEADTPTQDTIVQVVLPTENQPLTINAESSKVGDENDGNEL